MNTTLTLVDLGGAIALLIWSVHMVQTGITRAFGPQLRRMPGFIANITFDTAHGDPQLYADDRIINGSKFYVVLGCIAYMTFNAIHRSGFCYVLEWIAPA